MIFMFANFAETTLAEPCSAGDLVLKVPQDDSIKFPQPNQSQIRFAVVLMDGQQDPEICHVSSNPRNGTFVVERGAEGTGAKSWRAGTICINAPTKASLTWLASGGSDFLLLLEEEIENVKALISVEALARATLEDAFAQYQITVGTYFDQNSATITSLYQSYSDLNSAFVVYQLALQAQADESSARALLALNTTAEFGTSLAEFQLELSTAMGGLSGTDFALKIAAFSDFNESQVLLNADFSTRLGNAETSLTSEILLRSTQYTALVAVNTAQNASIGTNAADIATESSTRATQYGAISSSLTTVSTTVAGHTASISTQATSINGLQARWAVKLASDGITTVGIEANGVDKSWVFQANLYQFKDSSGTYTPFAIDAGTGKMYLTGDVYVNGNIILNGTIITPKIADEAVSEVDSVSMGGSRSGNGTYQVAVSFSVSPPYPAKIITIMTGQQSYSSGPKNWNAQGYLDSTPFINAGGAGAITDSFSASGAISVGAGSYSVAMVWLGEDSTLVLAAANLVVLVMKK